MFSVESNEQLLNIPQKLVTLDVFQCDTSSVASDLHQLNMPVIVLTLDVFHVDISNSVNVSQP